MPTRHDQFIHEQNVKKYQQQLMRPTDVGQRKLLMALLREEAAKAKTEGWMPPFE